MPKSTICFTWKMSTRLIHDHAYIWTIHFVIYNLESATEIHKHKCAKIHCQGFYSGKKAISLLLCIYDTFFVHFAGPSKLCVQGQCIEALTFPYAYFCELLTKFTLTFSSIKYFYAVPSEFKIKLNFHLHLFAAISFTAAVLSIDFVIFLH